jgi:hypothetical protein
MNQKTAPEKPAPTPTPIIVIKVVATLSAVLWGITPIVGGRSAAEAAVLWPLMIMVVFLIALSASVAATKTPDGQPVVIPMTKTIPTVLMLLLAIGNLVRFMI